MTQTPEPIAIVGLALRVPGAESLDALWDILSNGRSMIGALPHERRSAGFRADEDYFGAFVQDADAFDPEFFGISPREAGSMDPQQRFGLELAWNALEDAGIRPSSLAKSDTGVFMGICHWDYLEMLSRADIPVEAHRATGVAPSIASNRISYQLDLRGPSVTNDSACASALVAIEQAATALRAGQCGAALAGGVNLIWSPDHFRVFSKNGMLSKTGSSRAFDAKANGYVRGEGGAVFVLKTLSAARANGDPVHALIRDVKSNHGGHSAGLTVTNPEAQADLIAQVMRGCGVHPATLDYVEAHGTGTPVGDPIEVRGLKGALAQLYDEAGDTPEPGRTAIGSVKTNIGHLEGAAGIAGALKVIAAMKAEAIPPNATFEKLNPLIKLDESPLRVASNLEPWPESPEAAPRRAGVSSFGFGGTNAHALLEAVPTTQDNHKTSKKKLIFPLSARSEAALRARAADLAAHLKSNSQLDTTDLAYTLQTGREDMGTRLVVRARKARKLIKALKAYARGKAHPDLFTAQALGPKARIAAWLHGGAAKWSKAATGRERLHLPAYRFERQPYWFEDRSLITIARQGDIVRCHVPAGHAILADHVIDGRPVLPGTATVSLVRASAALVRQRPDVLTKLRWLRPAVADEKGVVLDISFDAGGKVSVRDADGQEVFRAILPDDSPALSAQARPDRGPSEPPALLYADLVTAGIAHGPAFQVVDTWHQNEDRATGVLAPIRGAFLSAEPVHPIHLDAVIQVASRLSLPNGAPGAPFAAERIDFADTLGDGKMTCEALATGKGAFDVALFQDGASVAQITGLVTRPVVRSAARDGLNTKPCLIALPQGTSWEIADQRTPAGIRTTLDQADPDTIALCNNAGDQREVTVPDGADPKDIAWEVFEAARDIVSQQTGLLALRIPDTHSGLRQVLHPMVNALVLERASCQLAHFGSDSAAPLDPPSFRIAEAPKPNANAIIKGGVFWILGGTGGIGLIMAQHLKSKGARAVILSGRTARDILGFEVLACDGTDQADLQATWAKITNEYGQINGVIHGAGLVEDALARNKSRSSFDQVFDAKVETMTNLVSFVRKEPLDFLISLSSVAAVHGAMGQADYAAANARLNQMTTELAQNVAFPVTSLGWTLWAGGGMQVPERVAQGMADRMGTRPIPTQSALRVLEAAMTGDLPTHAVVGYGDADRFSAFLNTRSDILSETPKPDSVRATSLDRAPILAELGQMLADTLAIDPTRIDPSLNFDAYGFDSLLAVEMVERIEAWTAETVSTTLFFEALDLNGVADKLIADIPETLSRLTATDAASTVPEPVTEPVPVNSPAPRIQRTPADNNRDIAIIGMGGRYPGARDLGQFWENLKAGRHDFTPIPEHRWPHEQIYFPERSVAGKSTIQTGGFLEDIDKFDPRYFGISQSDAECMSPEVRLLLECAVETFENAGYGRETLADQMQGDVGVLVGTMSNHYNLYGVQNMLTRGARASGSYTGTIPNMISYFYHLTGPSIFVDTMCSQSLTAVDLGVRLLREGQCRMVLAGGINLLLHPLNLISSSQEHFTSNRAEVIRSFGLGADGTILGEGAGLVLLKPLADAERDGDNIQAVIKGTAMANAGPRNGFTVPNPAMQTKAVTDALADAGLRPDDISYIETHGSGTKLGDPIEIAALKSVFGRDGEIPIGSVKSNIAHLLAAAGVAGLTKLVLQLKHGQIAPSLHSEALNPAIPFDDTPFTVNQTLTEWRATGPRRGGLTSIGAGGMNNHMIVEERLAQPHQASSDGPRVMVFSAASVSRLSAMMKRMQAWLATNLGADPARVAYTLQVGRTNLRSRAAIVAEDLESFADQIEAYLAGQPHRFHLCEDVLASPAAPQDRGTAPEAVARAWANGQSINWHALWGGVAPQRIELPTYPFERVSCWYEVFDDAPSVLNPLTFQRRLHPLLADNTSDLSGASFETTLRTDDLLDYVTVAGGTQTITPWLALDAAFATLDLAGRSTASLANVTLDAEALTEGADLKFATQDGAAVEARASNGVWLSAIAATRGTSTPAPVPLSCAAWTQKEIDEAFQEAGIQRGPYAQGLSAFTFQSGRIEAEIYTCDYRQDHDTKNSRLSPAMLIALGDLCRIAAKAAGAQDWHRAHVAQLAVLELGDASQTATRLAGEVKVSNGAYTLDILLLDSTGQVVGEARGVTLSGAMAVAQTDPHLGAAVVTQSKLETVRGIVAGLLSFQESEIDPYTRFHDMGFDSISLSSLTGRLNTRFGTKLTPALFYDVANIEQLLPQLPEPKAGPASVEARPQPLRNGAALVQTPAGDDDVALLGMAARVPGADTPTAYWDLIAQKRSGLGSLPLGRFAPHTQAQFAAAGLPPKGGYLSDIARFDADFFQISPLEAEVMDPQQRLVLEAVWHALEDAALRPDALPPKTGVYVGASSLDYASLMRAEGAAATGYAATGNSLAMLSNRISHLFDLQGPSQTIDTACSSSLVAVHRAVRALKLGECDAAIVAGVNVTLALEGFAGPLDAGMLSRHGRCSTFGADADGYVRGEGVAAVILKRAEDARANGDPVHALIVGSAENHCGRSASLTAPRTQAQADLVSEAMSGLDPAKVAMVEAHGTGTPLGDPVEVDGLNRAFSDFGLAPAQIAISSAKSNIGHLEAAAGLAGLIKVVLSMKAGTLPPHAMDGALNPHLNLAQGPLRIADALAPWPQARPLAGVSSFGFGGVGAHVVLQRQSVKQVHDTAKRPHLFVLSAQTSSALAQLAARLSEHMEASQVDPAALARSLRFGRQPMRERIAFVATTQREAQAALQKVARGNHAGLWSATLPGASAIPQSEAPNTSRDCSTLEAAAEAWCSGHDVNLAGDDENALRLHLPVYPFEGAHHWFTATEQPLLASAPVPPSHADANAVFDDLISDRISLAQVAGVLDQGAKGPLQ
ncbi:MAG: SDR family NAD(P)-dependent oxidoreductase [Paracoccaceae bacterium]|nr:SDR family NAD(P)-dependent oxidoreductase [Paracoccaceae bacterium]